MLSPIQIKDYTYQLPPDRIAAEPLAKRDESKLLVYKNGDITHTMFKRLADLLPANSHLFFNDTKVIPARIFFQKDTGADIEVFLLSPVAPDTLLAVTMLAKNQCSWQCTIGNLKRWKDDQILSRKIGDIEVTASLSDRLKGIVTFKWTGDYTFSEVLARLGATPLPPYIKRPATQQDATRYQTIYSNYDGAVAAPTAGLHFTDEVFKSLQDKNIGWNFLTLHVSAGTFQPVKVENALEHSMHQEQIVVNRENLNILLQADRFIVAVGTTSLRTLESLYWFGVKLIEKADSEFIITQQDPYGRTNLPATNEALKVVAQYMDAHSIENLTGLTSIFIHPGYEFKICKGLITNFHQPASTLMLLVAAFVGPDWQKIYAEALRSDYRFLSYGDSSLLLP